MSSILYVSRSGIPRDAASIRIERIAQVLCKIGYDVSIMCSGVDAEYIPLKNDSSHDYRMVVNDIPYLFSYRKSYKWYNKFRVVHEIIFATSIYKRIIRYCDCAKPQAIILYNDIYSLTRKLLKYCRNRGIALYADVTEWYEKKSTRNSLPARLIPILVNKRITTLDCRLNGIIAISPYLYDYYSKLNNNVVYIPPLMPIHQDIEFIAHKSKVIVYAGKPGEKDVILPILDAFEILNKKEIKAILTIIGIDEGYIRQVWKDIPFSQYGIQILGTLPHSDTLDVVKQADFGILLRHNKRYAKAGFSTKLAECLSLGIPMICNRIGGCDSIIEHSVDGMIIDDFAVDNILDCLKSVVELSDSDMLKMKHKAFEKAEMLFNSEKYITKLQVLLEHENSNIGR